MKEKISQAQVIGRLPMKTWADYRQGCLDSFGGGHHHDGKLDAFQHGMNTIFNLLENEFPPAEDIREQTAEIKELVIDLTVARMTIQTVEGVNAAANEHITELEKRLAIYRRSEEWCIEALMDDEISAVAKLVIRELNAHDEGRKESK